MSPSTWCMTPWSLRSTAAVCYPARPTHTHIDLSGYRRRNSEEREREIVTPIRDGQNKIIIEHPVFAIRS